MPTVAEAGSSSIDRLDEAAKQHEQDFVIDFGSDRLIKWVGVYLFLGLAIVVKIAESVETNIHCFPENSSDANEHLISFATAYCWDTTQNLSTPHCPSKTNPVISLLQNPSLLKEFIQWFPYFLLIQAFAFALPWSYWHFTMGARLIGHLRFMQLLLSSIFDKLKEIETVFYDETPYDEKCRNFDGSHVYESKLSFSSSSENNQPLTNPTLPQEQVPQQTSDTVASSTVNIQNVSVTFQNPSASSSLLASQGATTNSANNQTSKKKKAKTKSSLKLTCFEKLVVGEMTDRHFFSMLCFENFASMHHLPYILSVFQLTKSQGTAKEPEAAYYYLNQGLLNLWCDNKNMNNILIIKRYLYKHLISACLSVLFLILLLAFGSIAYKDAISSSSFACEIQDGLCLICSIRQKRDIFAIFLINIFLDFVVLIMSVRNWINVRSSVDQIKCHYFDQLKETTNIAMTLACETNSDDDED